MTALWMGLERRSFVGVGVSRGDPVSFERVQLLESGRLNSVLLDCIPKKEVTSESNTDVPRIPRP